jgi:hypothetical protein
MHDRTQGTLAYAIILGVCTIGVLQMSLPMSLWGFVAGACALALISIFNHPVAYRAFGGAVSPGVLLFSSFLNATMTSAAALVVGRVIGWVWGV